MEEREKIAKYIYLMLCERPDDYWKKESRVIRTAYMELADKVLALKLVKLADNQELPANPYPNTYVTDVGVTIPPDPEREAGRIGYAEAQQDMLKDGFQRVE